MGTGNYSEKINYTLSYSGTNNHHCQSNTTLRFSTMYKIFILKDFAPQKKIYTVLKIYKCDNCMLPGCGKQALSYINSGQFYNIY